MKEEIKNKSRIQRVMIKHDGGQKDRKSISGIAPFVCKLRMVSFRSYHCKEGEREWEKVLTKVPQVYGRRLNDCLSFSFSKHFPNHHLMCEQENYTRRKVMIAQRLSSHTMNGNVVETRNSGTGNVIRCQTISIFALSAAIYERNQRSCCKEEKE